MVTKKQLIRLIEKLCDDPIESLVEYGHNGADVERCKFCGEQKLAHWNEPVIHDKDCPWLQAMEILREEKQIRKKGYPGDRGVKPLGKPPIPTPPPPRVR